ncbi:hypothetical protein [Caldisericum sp.]|uniref:hypothetical protein n=1 Tax=Caldisericum sp. TaxID=2499687 RepID=UPI003D14C2E6
MNKNTFLPFILLFLGGILLISVAFPLSSKINKLLTASLQFTPPQCPFHVGLTPNQIKTDSEVSLKQEAILLKLFFTQAVLDKRGVAICKESESLNTCLARFQDLCYQQGKCQEQYDGSNDATLTSEIQSYLCTIWSQRYSKLFTTTNWPKVNSLFTKLNTPIPSWLSTSYTNYLAFKINTPIPSWLSTYYRLSTYYTDYLSFKNRTTTTTLTSSTTTLTSSTTTTTLTSSSTLYAVNIDEFRPKAKDTPVLSVSPDIDISQIVPAGYSYAPRIESWLYYLDGGIHGLTGTISESAPPQSSYLVLATNSSRKYKVERIDTDGTFTDITNDPDTKWEVSMPISVPTDQSCFHFTLKDLSPEEMEQLENYKLKPRKFKDAINALKAKMLSPELQSFLNQDNNKLQEYISQTYNIPLSSYLVPIVLPLWNDHTAEFIDGHYVGLCKQLNRNTNQFTGVGWNNCIFSYYKNNNGIWSIDSTLVQKYKQDQIDHLNSVDPKGEYISSVQKQIFDSTGIQEGFCMENLTQEQKDLLNSLQSKYQGLVRVSDNLIIPLEFNINDYLTFTNDGKIQAKDKEGAFYVTVTDTSSTVLEKIKKFFHIATYNSANVTFPIIIIDFNKYNNIINETLNDLITYRPGASKYIKTYYKNIPGLYGIDYTCNSISGNVSQLMVKGVFLNEVSDNCPYGVYQEGADIYSLFPDTIFISKDPQLKFDLLDKGFDWFAKRSMFYPIPSIFNSVTNLAEVGNSFPFSESAIYSKITTAVSSLQNVLYDADTNLLGRGIFLHDMAQSKLNSVKALIPCQNLTNARNPHVFSVEGVSLNNPNWHDEISFSVFNCTPNPAMRKVCANNANLIYCKNYSVCLPIPDCSRKDPVFQKNHNCTYDTCPKYTCNEGGGVDHGQMVCPEECAHHCDVGLYMDANCTQPFK